MRDGGEPGGLAPDPVVVGVVPAAELAARPLLLGALELAYAVRFEGRQPGELRGLGAVLDLGDGKGAQIAAAAGLPALALLLPEPGQPGAAAAQELCSGPELHRALRGAILPDARLGAALRPGAALADQRGTTVLARCAGQPIWARWDRLEAALLAPRELGAAEALRERLCGGRSAALLPLVHFLVELTREVGWQPPAPAASLLLDDPNLHWTSYGYVDLAALAGHAREHGYHAALATVPLDAWFAQGRALRALAHSEGAVSLLAHGNDHDGAELGRVRSEGEAIAIAAQALRRLAAFERRTGVAVDRVMVPPHEECSEATARGLLRCGFEAITMTRPYPWLAPPPAGWLTRPPRRDALVGWRPADFTRGLPLLLRHPLRGRSAPELALRAFLGQPLILYGHHDDLRGGLGVLAEAAADVERLGPTRWCRLGEIAAGAYETRRDGALLGVRLLANRVRVDVPASARRLAVDLPPSYDGPPRPRLTVGGRPAALGEPVAVEPETEVTIELRPEDAVDFNSVPPRRRQPLALARRVASESRDRLAPLLGPAAP